MGGGASFAPFVHVDRGGVCRMSTLVHSRGGGGQNWVKIILFSIFLNLLILKVFFQSLAPFFIKDGRIQSTIFYHFLRAQELYLSLDFFLILFSPSCKTTFYSNSNRSLQFLKQNYFLTCSWRFFRSNTLEQFIFKSGKNYWGSGKVRKKYF